MSTFKEVYYSSDVRVLPFWKMTACYKKEAVIASINQLLRDLLKLILIYSQDQIYAEEKRRRVAEQQADNEARRHSDWFT